MAHVLESIYYHDEMANRTEQINIRATRRERAAWEAAAAADDCSLSGWLVRRANGDRASAPPVVTPATTAEPAQAASEP
jgi:hypothetical protein